MMGADEAGVECCDQRFESFDVVSGPQRRCVTDLKADGLPFAVGEPLGDRRAVALAFLVGAFGVGEPAFDVVEVVGGGATGPQVRDGCLLGVAVNDHQQVFGKLRQLHDQLFGAFGGLAYLRVVGAEADVLVGRVLSATLTVLTVHHATRTALVTDSATLTAKPFDTSTT